ncbi:MAG: hypothetical protein K6A94_08795 [Bacteroidales bacterium]|nr:hypothetical protein [Bacteroidales bacterium]
MYLYIPLGILGTFLYMIPNMIERNGQHTFHHTLFYNLQHNSLGIHCIP